MDLSHITKTFTESVIREMTRVANQHPNCINLAQGFPDFPAPELIKNAAIQAITANVNQYAITWGSQNLRNAIANKVASFNNIKNINPQKNITVTCGSTEAMMSAMKAIINPGDEVIIFEPFYENYGPDCILSGATPRFIRLKNKESEGNEKRNSSGINGKIENNNCWSFDFTELEQMFNKKTKAIIINTPNNPTGKIFSEKELKFISNLCLQHDCIAVTDEIYEHILFDGLKHISIASLPGMEDHSITINSISKSYSLTGWRVGWTIACERITAEIKKVHDFLTVGAAAPLQEAAAFALTLDETYYKWLHDFYTNARDTLYNALLETPLHPIKPKGAYYIMTECGDFMKRNNLATSYDLAIFLIKKIGIATVPGSSFYSNPRDGDSQTRFCFCKKPETLAKATENLKKL